MSALSPKFVVFEGIEGAGKSTLIRYLAKLLESFDCHVTVTREPGGTSLADDIRSMLLRTEGEQMHAHTELCLLAASRSQHVQEVLKPALASNHWILCDRFCDSSVAYQGYGRGIDRGFISKLNEFVCEGLVPDRVIICDIEPSVALERIKKRKKDRIEDENLEFFERVRAGYLEIAATSEHYHVLNASMSLSDVLDSIYQYLKLTPSDECL